MRHVVVMTTAASVGLMAIFLVDLVDIFFISMLGNSAITAAVAYAGTILFFSTSIVIGMSIATSALVANALGAGDDNRARSSATSTALFGIPVSIIVSIFVLLNIEMLTGLTGATGESQRLAIEYLRIIVPSNPILMIGLVSASVIRAHGNAKRSMYT
jgi:Na+-driven multidrug efflux pump